MQLLFESQTRILDGVTIGFDYLYANQHFQTFAPTIHKNDESWQWQIYTSEKRYKSQIQVCLELEVKLILI